MNQNFDVQILAMLGESSDIRATVIPAVVGCTSVMGGVVTAIHTDIDVTGQRRSGRTTAAFRMVNEAMSRGLRAAYITPRGFACVDELSRNRPGKADMLSAAYLRSVPHALTRYQFIVVDDADQLEDDAKDLIRRLRHPDASLTYWVREAPHPAP